MERLRKGRCCPRKVLSQSVIIKRKRICRVSVLGVPSGLHDLHLYPDVK